MEKQSTVYRFSYSGDRIRCVRVAEEEPGQQDGNAHWYVVILGVIAAYGWWFLWR